MKERRSALRQRSFLQGRILYNNRRSSVDCLIRDISESGARLKFSEAVTVPELIELYIPNKDEYRRARAQWRAGNEMGVAFEDGNDSSATPASSASDLAARMLKAENDIAALKRIVNELRAELRKQQGGSI